MRLIIILSTVTISFERWVKSIKYAWNKIRAAKPAELKVPLWDRSLKKDPTLIKTLEEIYRSNLESWPADRAQLGPRPSFTIEVKFNDRTDYHKNINISTLFEHVSSREKLLVSLIKSLI